MTSGKYIIPSVGTMFKRNNVISFKLPVDAEDYEMIDIDMNNIQLNSVYAFIDNKFAIKVIDELPLKGRLINKIFSNDDEIAILLNYQASKTAENKAKLELLQSWRNWFGNLAKIIEQKYSE